MEIDDVHVIQEDDLCDIGKKLSLYSMSIFINHVENCEECQLLIKQNKENAI